MAKAYPAACTPNFFMFNGDRKLVYRGKMDDSWPDSSLPVTRKYFRATLDAALVGQEPSGDQKLSLDFNIK